MDEEIRRDDRSEDLLKRALLDAEAVAAVALKVDGLPALRVGHDHLPRPPRPGHHPDLCRPRPPRHRRGGLAQRAAARPVRPRPRRRRDREEAEQLYAEQAAALRDALVGADTVLDIWREPLSAMAGSTVAVDRSIELQVNLPAHRVLPVALVAPERQLVVAPVCGARTLAQGRPPLGIACAQQDVARVYPLPDDPERCLEDFLALASEHARQLAARLEHQEASVERFLELTGDDQPPWGLTRPPSGIMARRVAPRPPPPRRSRRPRLPGHQPRPGARADAPGTGTHVAVDILRAQVHGDRGEVLRRLDGCRRSACRAEALRSRARLRSPGTFQVLNVDSKLHPGWAAPGPVRVAWRVDSHLPIVQCVRVRRTGSVIAASTCAWSACPPPSTGSPTARTNRAPPAVLGLRLACEPPCAWRPSSLLCLAAGAVPAPAQSAQPPTPERCTRTARAGATCWAGVAAAPGPPQPGPAPALPAPDETAGGVRCASPTPGTPTTSAWRAWRAPSRGIAATSGCPTAPRAWTGWCASSRSATGRRCGSTAIRSARTPAPTCPWSCGCRACAARGQPPRGPGGQPPRPRGLPSLALHPPGHAHRRVVERRRDPARGLPAAHRPRGPHRGPGSSRAAVHPVRGHRRLPRDAAQRLVLPAARAVSARFGARAAALGTATSRPAGSARSSAASRSGTPAVVAGEPLPLPGPRAGARGRPTVAGWSVHSGVRSIKVVGGHLYVNGQPTHFRGVGIHEDSPDLGSALDNPHRDRWSARPGSWAPRSSAPTTRCTPSSSSRPTAGDPRVVGDPGLPDPRRVPAAAPRPAPGRGSFRPRSPPTRTTPR